MANEKKIAVILLLSVEYFLSFYSNCRPLEGYVFPVFSTKFCPRNLTEWNERSSVLNCSQGNAYMCVPDENFTELLEFCYSEPQIQISKGLCMFLYKRHSTLDAYKCSHFTEGCPGTNYRSQDVHIYQSCVSIANGSFLAEPTWERTTAMYYLSNSTTTPAQSKTTKSAQNKIRNWVLIATISGIFIAVCIITLLVINKTEKDTELKETNGQKKKENHGVEEGESLLKDNPKTNPKAEVVKSNEREKNDKTGSTRSNNRHHKERQDNSLASDLFAACDNGHHTTVHDLLNKGADINTFSREDYTPLLIACNRGHTNTVQLLLKKNADINLCNKDGISPLYIACQNGHDITVQFLLNKDVDMNLCKNNGASPLLIACKNGHEGVVQRLLEKRANIDLCLNDGASPLFIACQKGHYRIVELLLRNGAALNNYRNDGASPLSIAIHKEYNEITQLLNEYGANID